MFDLLWHRRMYGFYELLSWLSKTIMGMEVDFPFHAIQQMLLRVLLLIVDKEIENTSI